MTEQLYRRRGDGTHRAWRAGYSEPPEWLKVTTRPDDPFQHRGISCDWEVVVRDGENLKLSNGEWCTEDPEHSATEFSDELFNETYELVGDKPGCFRQRAPERPVRVWFPGDPQPDWLPDHQRKVSETHLDKSPLGWKFDGKYRAMIFADDFEREYEPLPAPAPDAREALEIARQALRKIAAAPTWRCPDKWETTPAALRLIAKDALARIGGGA